MARRYLIETFGCQMNFHDSERLAGLLEQAGYEPAASAADADVVVINTCSVRERAEEKLYSRLGELRRPAAGGTAPLVAVAGCVAQQEGGRLLERSDLIDVVVGTQALKRLPVLLEDARDSREPAIDINPYEDVSFPLGLTRRGDPVKAYVTIIEGCNEFCSFCVVPYTRGHERMRRSREILREVEEAVAGGRPEIHLLGQIVNHYQAPDAPAFDFADLLERVGRTPGVRRVRFASPHPRYVTRRLIEVMRDVPAICRHLHLPIQSGSNAVLERMRRRHTRERYLEIVAEVREAMPEIALSTDMIVGFPGETPEDFEATLTLTEAVRFHSMFSFKYSPRPNTLAIKRLPETVTDGEKTRRLMELQALQRRIQEDLHGRMVGRVVDVLVDSTSRRNPDELAGRTGGNTVVNLAGRRDLLGELVPVRVTRAGPNSLRGEVVRRSRLDARPAAP